MKRLLLYVHFHKYGIISPHVFYQLTKIRPLFENILFISNSPIKQPYLSELENLQLADGVLLRENKGFDFAAWRDGLTELGFEEVASYDSVTLMNDTCFGPLWELSPLYRRFEQDDQIDFWGMTNHRASDHCPKHIQSYFVVYKKKLASSKAFKDYWLGIKDHEEVQEVIDRYETQSTAYFQSLGFASGVVFDTVNRPIANGLPPDFSLYQPTELLTARVPFFKVKITEVNNAIAPYLLDYISKHSDYPIDLILHHLSDVFLPDEPYQLGQKYTRQLLPVFGLERIAVHLHVFYTDLLEEFLTAFQTFDFSYDLFLTTDTKAKEGEIRRLLKKEGLQAEIFVFENRGRDILPLLRLREVLSSYDIIGHFHTKKSKEADFWAGESWRRELIESLIVGGNTLVSQLRSKTLGLVIADIPTFFRYNKIVDVGNEAHLSPLMNDLWKKMKLEKVIDFTAFPTFVMSYGTFAWFRYDALKPLFELEIKDQDIPCEPLGQHTVLHAMERLLVYIAWNQHYDFRIARPFKQLTPFVDSQVLNRHFAAGMKQAKAQKEGLERDIQGLLSHQQELKTQLEEKQRELDRIYASRTWKIRNHIVDNLKKVSSKKKE